MTVTGGVAPGRDGGLVDRVRILLVDDDETWARVTARLLASNNDAFEVTTAHSLAAGRREFAARDPDCVVCDYQLGDGTGLALLDTVRKTDPDRPFVLVTGRGDESVASEAIGRGVTDYIRKDRDDDEADLLASRITRGVRSYRIERALERERRSKTALLEVITGATGETDLSREFCGHLVEERGYACAWIGRDDPGGPVPQAVAGREAYLDAVLTPGERLPADEPARRALDRGEPVRTRIEDGDADATAETWASLATDHGFEGAIAVPVRHDGVRFGVLAAYADDRSLLTDSERETVVEFAETVGYALTSAERKHALMSSSPVTLRVEFDVDEVPLGRLRAALPDGAGLELLSTVPRGDGATLYVTEIRGASPDGLDAVVAVDGVRSIEDASDATRCELVVADPTPEEVLASRAVRVAETTVDGDAVTLSLRVPDETPVATVRDVLEREFDGADVSAIWTGRDGASTTSTGAALAEMTDRQREILRHAYDVGYFERPRDANATELADHFDVARATLTQHLRTAERKLLGEVFSDCDPK